ncbi:MAG: hypothetical protein N2558_04900 [Patescibacteria group bacterium]|nr:hypothetical protein [Patescibacteria group bacterium]
MEDIVKQTIENLDAEASTYGYSAEEHGLTLRLPQIRKSIQPTQPTATNYSSNPSIAAVGKGASTFMVKVSVKKIGTGSGNTSNPVFLFGPNAILGIGAGYGLDNTVGYLSVMNANQKTRFGVDNGKNVLKFIYGDDTNNHTYTVTLGTAGEYPFFLGTLTKSQYNVVGIQIEISDENQVTQLTSSIQHFKLNAFGKSETNDLTTPRDLYQQQRGGVFIPHNFLIGPNMGIIADVLAIDNFEVKYYFFVK